MTSATVFPDTTILIQYKPLNLVDWKALLGVNTVIIVLAPSVIQEIKDIKNQDISSNLAMRAAMSLQTIENLQVESQSRDSRIKLHFPDEPEIDFRAEGLNPNSVADLLIASIIDHQSTSALEYILLYSEDQETVMKAATAGIEIKTLPDEYRVDLKRQKRPSAPAYPIIDPLTSSPSVPISTPLSTPSPLFPHPNRELAPQGPPSEQAKPAEEPAPLLSLSDIGINDLKLPETPYQNGHTFSPLALDNGTTSQEDNVNAQEANTSKESADGVFNQASIPEHSEAEIQEKDVPVAQKPPEKQDTVYIEPPPPIINIIQEPSNSIYKVIEGPTSDAPKPPVEKAEAPPTEEQPIQKAPVQQERPASPATHSFSFVSQTPASKPPKPVDNAFIPSETVRQKSNLRLSVSAQDESRTTVVIHHPIYPSLDDVNKHLSTVRSNFPKLHLPYEAGGDGLGNDLLVKNMPYGSIAPDTILQRKAQRIKKYNSSLDHYYSGIEKYLSDNAEFDNFKRRSAQIDLTLFNDLPEDLKSLYISIHFPGNVRVYHDENIPERPSTPPPPEEPDLDMLFDPIRLPQVPIPNELSNASDLKMRGRNPAPLEVRWNKGWDVIYSIREIEKNNKVPFNPLYIAFNSFDHATSFRINYRITVASASYEQLGELEIVVRKEI